MSEYGTGRILDEPSQRAYDAGRELGREHGATDPRALGETPDFDNDDFYGPMEEERDDEAKQYGGFATKPYGAFFVGYEDGFNEAIAEGEGSSGPPVVNPSSATEGNE